MAEVQPTPNTSANTTHIILICSFHTTAPTTDRCRGAIIRSALRYFVASTSMVSLA